MCLGFGDMATTEKKTTNTQLPDYLSRAAQKNIADAGAVTSAPFQSYTAPRVADLTPDQQTAGGLIRAVAGSSDPYTDQIKGLYDTYSNTAAPSISAPSIIGPNIDPRTASISDYINPYIDAALTPTLQAIARQGAQARKGINASATMSGAFGDARHGIESSNQLRDEGTNVGNATGQAYGAAFDRAAALRGTDIGNLLTTQKANADYGESALLRALTGGTALTNLDKYNTGRTVDLANALDKSGAEQRTVQQAKLDTDYQEFMRRLGYNADQLKLMTSVLAGTPHDTTQTSTTEKPDNSGWGLIGAGASLALAPFTGGMSLAGIPGSLGSMGGTSTGFTGNTTNAFAGVPGATTSFMGGTPYPMFV